MPVRRLVVLAAVTVLLSTGTAADAQVVVDPDSPSAKEYAIPLERERRQADPTTPSEAGVIQGERTSPLFGEGIAASEATGGKSEATGAKSEATGARSEAPGETSEATGVKSGGRPPREGGASKAVASNERDDANPSPDAPADVRAAIADPGAPDGGGTSLIIGGVALVVVAIGGAAGLLLRRRA